MNNPVGILETRSKLVLYQHGLSMCLDLVRLRAMLEYLQEHGPTTVETLAGRLPSNMHGRVVSSVPWCAKMGLLQVDSPQQAR
jgi:hypothetical protein